MTQIKIAFKNKSAGLVAGFQNTTGTYDPRNIGTVIADLLDVSGIPTGLSLEVAAPLHGTTGSTSYADADAWGYNVGAYRNAWITRSSTANGTLRISGFAAGQEGAMTVCGHTNTAARDTDYFINGGAANRYDATAKPPAEPITFLFSANASGYVDITTAYTSIYAYLNFIDFTFEESSSPSIDSVDQCKTGQTSQIVFTAEFAAIEASISDSVVIKTYPATTVDTVSVEAIIPEWIDGETAIKMGAVTLKASDGVSETAGYATILEYWDSHPDNPNIIQFSTVELTSVSADSIGVVFGFNPPLKMGTQVVFDAARFTVGSDGKTTGDYSGLTLFRFRDPDDKKARSFILDTSIGP
ncbi:hypothetical protein [Paenibacillus sp. PAMC21692]|uniref:hypothetical protein n=1 Tax=Paenibacillus sp. PAMC21692 TaxID=2762320 RepID=UPI00164E830A|nr:hypothetical protein [Paenibacillus sp. PAMC21692]QNK59313.1 hypothetical protein H7F31_10765 [Paenibacillus sp. PAMC21692]